MTICFTLDGIKHCFHIPLFYYPLHPPKPDPELKGYADLLSDATILASFHAGAKSISNAAVREAVTSGLSGALKTLQHQAGDHVSVSFTH